MKNLLHQTEEEKEIYKLAYLEMLADWLSFGFKIKQDKHKDSEDVSLTGDDNVEFEDWYNKNKDKIMIHPDMKDWLDNIIKDIITDIRENSKNIYGESYTFNSKERKHEDNDSYIIRTDKGFIRFMPNNSYKIVTDINDASIGYNKDDMKMMLITLLRKFKQLKIAKLSTVADAKKYLNTLNGGLGESMKDDGIEIDGVKGTISNSGMAM